MNDKYLLLFAGAAPAPPDESRQHGRREKQRNTLEHLIENTRYDNPFPLQCSFNGNCGDIASVHQ